jgi:hypothetical protein
MPSSGHADAAPPRSRVGTAEKLGTFGIIGLVAELVFLRLPLAHDIESRIERFCQALDLLGCNVTARGTVIIKNHHVTLDGWHFKWCEADDGRAL